MRLAEAGGYANVGKTNLHEFAYGITSENEHFGTVPNPLRTGPHRRRLFGRLCSGARCFTRGCGSRHGFRRLDPHPGRMLRVVGFKPTYELVSTVGCFPLAPSFDHVGPMARTVGGVRRAAPGDRTWLHAGGAGLPRRDRGGDRVDGRSRPAGNAERVRDAAGHFPRRRSLEWPRPVIGALFMREVADVHRELYAENGELYGEELAVKIERCLAVSDAEAKRAEQARVEYRRALPGAPRRVRPLLTPTLQCVAPPTGIGDLALRERLIANTIPFNTLGWPALALPCGPAEDGLPASVQLVGRPGADALVLAAGSLLASLI